MKKAANLINGTVIVSKVVRENISMFDTVLVVSQGGVRRLCFTSTGGDQNSHRCDYRSVSWGPTARADFWCRVERLI